MDNTWTITELAEAAAAALDGEPRTVNGRVRDLPNERLIRWYATIGLVDPPLGRRGRTALYGPRHLLQLVAIKRRQAAGRTIAEIQIELAGATDTMLREIAQLPTSPLPAPPRAPRPGPGHVIRPASMPEPGAAAGSAPPTAPLPANQPQPTDHPHPAGQSGPTHQSRPTDRSGPSDQPSPTDQPGATHRSGPTHQPGTTDHPRPANQPGTTDQPGTADQPGADQSGPTDQPSPTGQSGSTHRSEPTHQPGTTDHPRPANQPGAADQSGLTDHPRPAHRSRSAYQSGSGDVQFWSARPSPVEVELTEESTSHWPALAQGVRLAPGVTLLVDGDALSSVHLAAIGEASRPLLAELRRLGLTPTTTNSPAPDPASPIESPGRPS